MRLVPNRLRSFLIRLKMISVWGPGGVPTAYTTSDREYDAVAAFYRVVLPLYDVGIMMLGIFGTIFGVPAIEEFFPHPITNVSCVLIFLSGLAAFAGISFPALVPLEAWGKIAFIGFMYGYAGSLIWLLFVDGEVTRGFVSVLAVFFTLLPLFRLYLLRRQRDRDGRLRFASMRLPA